MPKRGFTINVGPPDATPKCWSTRVLITAWWLICLVLISLYTANLAAYLTVTRINKEFETIHDLKDSGLPYGTVAGTVTDMLLSNTSDREIESLYRHVQMADNFTHGIERARTGRYVFLYGSAPLTYSSNQKPCGLKVTKTNILSYELAFAVPDESPIIEIINKGLIQMKEKNEILPSWRNWASGPCDGTLSTEPGKQPIRALYLGHVTGYQPIRDQYFLIRSVPARYI
eukprot:sb/3469503/